MSPSFALTVLLGVTFGVLPGVLPDRNWGSWDAIGTVVVTPPPDPLKALGALGLGTEVLSGLVKLGSGLLRGLAGITAGVLETFLFGPASVILQGLASLPHTGIPLACLNDTATFKLPTNLLGTLALLSADAVNFLAFLAELPLELLKGFVKLSAVALKFILSIATLPLHLLEIFAKLSIDALKLLLRISTLPIHLLEGVALLPAPICPISALPYLPSIILPPGLLDFLRALLSPPPSTPVYTIIISMDPSQAPITCTNAIAQNSTTSLIIGFKASSCSSPIPFICTDHTSCMQWAQQNTNKTINIQVTLNPTLQYDSHAVITLCAEAAACIFIKDNKIVLLDPSNPLQF